MLSEGIRFDNTHYMSAVKDHIALTKSLNPEHNPYVKMLLNDFSDHALDEERAPTFKGNWKKFYPEQSFDKVDLEIGTGNGLHFAHRAQSHPNRLLLGIEIKFKPLVQSIRRALKNNTTKNAVMMRYNACLIQDLFGDEELDDVFIHHPDPWLKKKQWKHRLIQSEYLKHLYRIQKPGTLIEFKTDSEDYFNWAVPMFKDSPYEMLKYTKDLHSSDYAADNFVTYFEKIFIKKQQPIYYTQLRKN